MPEPDVNFEETLIWGNDGKPSAFGDRRSQKRSVLAGQRVAWDEGRPAEPEDILRDWPVDPARDPDAASVLAEDFLRRRRRGDEPSLDEYSRRFPELGGSLAGLISLRGALESAPEASTGQDRLLRLPEVGDEVFGFHLRHYLGRGAFARVFLAGQGDLAGRPVVLKVSAIEGSEPQTLAQLQHTNIVPIYSVHEDNRAGLRAVCMPYFGGASLSQVMERAWATPFPITRGEEFVEALRVVQAPAPEAVSRGGADGANAGATERSLLEMLCSQTYVQTAAWVVAQLADGLRHAHQRGILHRDIKPSNVLISAEGLPLLLDFNLAHDVHGDPGDATLGGTIAYMAPEHLRALIDPETADQVDRRSDIYSLGMVLSEMLTGHNPFEQSGSYSVHPLVIRAMAKERARSAPSLRAERTDVPWGLESISRKCLDPDPARRYQQAEHLADDLRRFLEDRPLKYAPELSRAEQFGKYVRRHPRLTGAVPVALAATLLLAGAGWALAGAMARLTSASHRLGEAGARERLRSHQAGLARAQCLINTTIDLRDNLREGVALGEKTLALFDPPGGGPRRSHPHWGFLDPADRGRVLEDQRELLVALASAGPRLAPGDPKALRRSLDLLAEAEAVPGLRASRAVWEERARILDGLGWAEQAEAARRLAAGIPPFGARDHYLLAWGLARTGTHEAMKEAVAELDRALRLDPRHYWSWVQRGICHLELDDPAAAAGDFGVCIGLWPEFAWGHFNRGYALDRAGRKAEAVQDYTTALDRDSSFLEALINRGLAHLELGRQEAAFADFEEARKRGREDASLHAARGMALEGLGRHAEADSAFEQSEALAGTVPEGVRTRLRWTYGFAVSRRHPDRALRAFEAVLASDPRHPQALYGLAMLAMTRGRDDEAMGFFDRAIEASPGLIEARCYRAVLLARRGEWEEAGREINLCLGQRPRDGKTLYAAACVAALASRAGPNAHIAEQAIDLLRRASAEGEPIEKARDDPDMGALRDLPQFRRLMTSAWDPGAGDGRPAPHPPVIRD